MTCILESYPMGGGEMYFSTAKLKAYEVSLSVFFINQLKPLLPYKSSHFTPLQITHDLKVARN